MFVITSKIYQNQFRKKTFNKVVCRTKVVYKIFKNAIIINFVTSEQVFSVSTWHFLLYFPRQRFKNLFQDFQFSERFLQIRQVFQLLSKNKQQQIILKNLLTRNLIINVDFEKHHCMYCSLIWKTQNNLSQSVFFEVRRRILPGLINHPPNKIVPS